MKNVRFLGLRSGRALPDSPNSKNRQSLIANRTDYLSNKVVVMCRFINNLPYSEQQTRHLASGFASPNNTVNLNRQWRQTIFYHINLITSHSKNLISPQKGVLHFLYIKNTIDVFND